MSDFHVELVPAGLNVSLGIVGCSIVIHPFYRWGWSCFASWPSSILPSLRNSAASTRITSRVQDR